jgi:hypothetical protein
MTFINCILYFLGSIAIYLAIIIGALAVVISLFYIVMGLVCVVSFTDPTAPKFKTKHIIIGLLCIICGSLYCITSIYFKENDVDPWRSWKNYLTIHQTYPLEKK